MTNKFEPSYSIYAFKEWLSAQHPLSLGPKPPAPPTQNNYGFIIDSRIGLVRLESQIADHNPQIDKKLVSELATTFKDKGGKLIDVQDLDAVIEVSAVQFRLPRSYTKNR